LPESAFHAGDPGSQQEHLLPHVRHALLECLEARFDALESDRDLNEPLVRARLELIDSAFQCVDPLLEPIHPLLDCVDPLVEPLELARHHAERIVEVLSQLDVHGDPGWRICCGI